MIAHENAIATRSPAVDPERPREDEAAPGLLSRSLYATGFYLAYGVTYPTLLMASVMPTNTAACHGLRDGAVAARGANRRVQARVSVATSAVAHKVSDTYAGVAQKVQERVESVQDSIAERRYNRRSVKA